jgi:predicted metalloprotease with PDZ domain
MLRTVLLSLFVLFAPAVFAADVSYYDVEYTVTLLPAQDQARVSIRLSKNAALVKRVSFHIRPDTQSDFRGDGELRVEGERAIWTPPRNGGTFSLRAKVSHQRASGEYDARMTANWAIFRGDDLVPAAKVRVTKGAQARAHLRFVLPAGWTNVDTGWPRATDGRFIIDNPERAFDRPVGWMIAGKVGTRREMIAGTELAVGAPKGSDLHRMDVISFLTTVWPEAKHAFGKVPPKLLVVGAGDPMWRGGLSSPNSFFLHAERPLVSENGTSSLLHELVHVITRVRGQSKDDWIAEGLAEFYAIELMHRAGAMSQARYGKVRAQLTRWGRGVQNLRQAKSAGPVTARAVILLQDLDREIRAKTDDQRDIDTVTRKLMRIGKVSLLDLREAAEAAAGGKLKTLDTPLLR